MRRSGVRSPSAPLLRFLVGSSRPRAPRLGSLVPPSNREGIGPLVRDDRGPQRHLPLGSEQPVKRSVVVRQEIDVSRESLWTACTTARGMAGWQADVVEGNAQLGGVVSLSWPALGLGVRLRVAELVEGERVVYEAGSARLTVELSSGAVALRHEGLRSEDEADGMRSAWQTALAVLGQGLLHHPGEPRFVRWFFSPARTTSELCHFYFTEPEGLRQWLCAEGGIGPTGSSIQLRLMSGATLTGQVLANTPDRDVAFSWEPHQACVVMRTFPSPQKSDQRLVAVSWSEWEEERFDEPTERFFDSALERLSRAFARCGSA
jgi:uncharacterized protein YndB with AHSA1/START domain